MLRLLSAISESVMKTIHLLHVKLVVINQPSMNVQQVLITVMPMPSAQIPMMLLLANATLVTAEMELLAQLKL